MKLLSKCKPGFICYICSNCKTASICGAPLSHEDILWKKWLRIITLQEEFYCPCCREKWTEGVEDQ